MVSGPDFRINAGGRPKAIAAGYLAGAISGFYGGMKGFATRFYGLGSESDTRLAAKVDNNKAKEEQLAAPIVDSVSLDGTSAAPIEIENPPLLPDKKGEER